MQFAILLIGALLFAFFSLKPVPIYFNERSYQHLKETKPEQAAVFEKEHQDLQIKFNAESKKILKLKETQSPQLTKTIQDFKNTQAEVKALHGRVEEAINNSNFNAEKTDTNYIFLYFVKKHLACRNDRFTVCRHFSGELGFNFCSPEFPCRLFIKRCSFDI